jgi:hypothetical protein
MTLFYASIPLNDHKIILRGVEYTTLGCLKETMVGKRRGGIFDKAFFSFLIDRHTDRLTDRHTLRDRHRHTVKHTHTRKYSLWYNEAPLPTK